MKVGDETMKEVANCRVDGVCTADRRKKMEGSRASKVN